MLAVMVYKTRVKTAGRMKRNPIRLGNRNVGIAEKRRERECADPSAVPYNGAVRSVTMRVLGATSAFTGLRAAEIENAWLLCELLSRSVLAYALNPVAVGPVTLALYEAVERER